MKLMSVFVVSQFFYESMLGGCYKEQIKHSDNPGK